MVHHRKPSQCQNDPHIGGSFWHSEGFLLCTMTLLQGAKDPVLPNLMYIDNQIIFYNEHCVGQTK